MPSRTVRLRHPLDLRATLRPIRRGRGDPTFRFTNDGAVRAGRGPQGTFLLHLRQTSDSIEAEAWGDGADWALDHVPGLIGNHDNRDEFVTDHPLVAELHRRNPGLRIGRTRVVCEPAVASVCEQKVTSFEAHRSWHQIVRRWGVPAPGPSDLLVPPDPVVLSGVPYYEMHVLGVERKRADTVLRVCAQARRLEPLAQGDPDPAALRARLTSIAGVGPWTAAEVSMVALGDPDAVSVGDYHLPNLVSHALAGEPRGTDERMLELLEPFAGHRGRVLRLLELSGLGPPRRGPRMSPHSIAAI